MSQVLAVLYILNNTTNPNLTLKIMTGMFKPDYTLKFTAAGIKVEDKNLVREKQKQCAMDEILSDWLLNDRQQPDNVSLVFLRVGSATA